MAISHSHETFIQVNESDPRYYGWRVVLAANLGVLGGFGSLFVYTFSVFLKPLSTQFGWSREAVSQGFAIAAIMVAVCSPAIGRWLDRLGPRRVILPCMALFGCAFASLALLRPHLWQFYATCLLMGGVGNGAAQLAYSRAIATWFRERLGLALALVMAGSGIGSMVLPVLAQTIISGWSWRGAYVALGVLALALGLPLSWRYVHEKTRDHLNPRPPQLSGSSWHQGIRAFPFWIVVASLFLNSISVNGVLAHLSAVLTDRGITAEGAALSISLLGAASLGGRLLVGGLLDRFVGSRVAFAMLMPAAAGILLLAKAATLPAGCVAAALVGVGMGAESDITPYLLTRYFGLRSFSTLYGFTWTFYAVAGALGPVIMGHAFDSTGSYAHTLTVLGFAMAVAASLMLLLPRYPESPQ
ncbi:MAG: MFS transporter [Terriglobia bacterium]